MNGRAILPLVESQPSEWGDPYTAYSYSYPHKSAYGKIDPPISLAPVWQSEDRRSLFLYFHIPFCEMRCGFCNLFARAGAEAGLVDAYLEALERQASAVDVATQGERTITRLALGGGTPTFLSARELASVFDIAERYFDACPTAAPTSVETSPHTSTAERLAVLKERGVERVSIGVQSFVECEVRAVGRPQTTRDVRSALERLRDFPTLNIDLMYGLPSQTRETWLESICQALTYSPEELYLYPLYVRPQTGIGRRGDIQRSNGSAMHALYRAARDLLLDRGYEQISMRYFRVPRPLAETVPVYCCQTDGMLGLGCGARSYSTWLHYSTRFAVEGPAVQAILQHWIGQTQSDFSQCNWGVQLSPDDRRRRFLIQSLLTRDGLNALDYFTLFGVHAADEFPVLRQWANEGWTQYENDHWFLTAAGMELSDCLGPALYSTASKLSLQDFTRE